MHQVILNACVYAKQKINLTRSYVEVYVQSWSCFKVWLKQDFFDKKDFDFNNDPIYPTFFC